MYKHIQMRGEASECTRALWSLVNLMVDNPSRLQGLFSCFEQIPVNCMCVYLDISVALALPVSCILQGDATGIAANNSRYIYVRDNIPWQMSS